MRLLGIFLVSAMLAAAAAAQVRPPLLIPAATLKADAPRDAAAQAGLIGRAEAAMSLKPPSVMDKTLTPASGDKHDFLSFGPYWWPDPGKPDGLPYVRRDGERNPAVVEGSDGPAFAKLCAAVEALGWAYWFTQDERYAIKAAMLTRVWFVDAQSRMNPNFQHAQAIPGISTGRGIGIIEARWLINLNEGLALLAASPAWTGADRQALQVWMAAFYGWLRDSANGRDEKRELNNHGTWYDAQVAYLALLLNHPEDAKEILSEGLTRRLIAQVEADGSQPMELSRTRSLNYAIFNLEALMLCAQLADHVGLDWWNFTSGDGRSLRGALAYLAPFADPAKPWPKADVHSADRRRLVPLMALFLQHREDATLRVIFSRASGTGSTDSKVLPFGLP